MPAWAQRAPIIRDPPVGLLFVRTVRQLVLFKLPLCVVEFLALVALVVVRVISLHVGVHQGLRVVSPHHEQLGAALHRTPVHRVGVGVQEMLADLIASFIFSNYNYH